MKRLRTLTAALLTVVLLFCAAAAETVALSPALEAQKLAISALREKYGLSLDSLGLFRVEVMLEDNAATVCFKPEQFLPVERIGEYTIRIAGDQTEVAWTHDDKDRALWQSNDPESPAWGEPMLQACLSNDTSWMVPYRSRSEETEPIVSFYDHLDFNRYFSEAATLPPTVAGDEAITLYQAEELADAAIMAVYGMPGTDLAALDHNMDAYYLDCSGGQVFWELTFADSERCFIILVDALAKEVCHMTLITGGNG